MKFSAIALATASLASAESLLLNMADSYIRNNEDDSRAYGYGRAVLHEGMQTAYELSKNETILDWYRSQIDGKVVDEEGTLISYNTSFYSLDEYRIGNNLLFWYEQTGEEKYKVALDTIRGMLNRHDRTPSGGFWHRVPIYKNQMWLDGIFMADTYYARYTAKFDADNTTAWDDIALQFDLIDAATRDNETGLLFHGFDESKTASWANDDTGASPLIWSRAVGWYFVSLVEVLQVFPKSHEGYQRLFKYYTTLAAALVEAQESERHGWWLIMNPEYATADGNYLESSAAAMFVYGWLAGVRLGYLDGKTYNGPATQGYQGLVKDFVSNNDDGTINFDGTVEVGSLNSDASFEVCDSRFPLL